MKIKGLKKGHVVVAYKREDDVMVVLEGEMHNVEIENDIETAIDEDNYGFVRQEYTGFKKITVLLKDQ